MEKDRFLVLKLGSTAPALRARRGDFEDWVIERAGLSRPDVRVIDVPAGESLPAPDGRTGVFLTGSHSMVTEKLEWSERTAEWLRQAVSRGAPVLGICYGHQLLAHAHGGTVGDNRRGSEFGTVTIALAEAGRADALLGTLPRRFSAHEGHTQSVLTLPPGAECLASNEWDPCQAFRIGERAWGIQFHPEFDSDIMLGYLDYDAQLLAHEGQDALSLGKAVRESPHSTAVLRKFVDLCRVGQRSS